MLSDLIQSESVRKRYYATPLGSYVEGFVSDRQAQGYSTSTLVSQLTVVNNFGKYLAAAGVDQLVQINESTVEAFVYHYRTLPTRRKCRLQAKILHRMIRPLLSYLRGLGVVAPVPAASKQPMSPFEPVLDDYLAFLRQHRGFAEATIRTHRKWATAFFVSLASRRTLSNLPEIGPAEIEDIVLLIGAGLRHDCREIMTSAVESVVAYLRSIGGIGRSCVPFLPRRKKYALSGLPSTIPWDAVERAIAAVDLSTEIGKRNHAILVLIATYGLRSSEVVGLCLDDIDWRLSVLHVRRTKTRHPLELPLVAPARDALITYLKQRGAFPDRHVFLRCIAPSGPVSRSIVGTAVEMALKQVGVQGPRRCGPHSVRHARATALVRAGHSLKTVGDLLGHRIPESTLIYCKLALEDLRSVALEVPEMAS